MSAESLQLLAADIILVSHVLFVAFVLLGLLSIYVGEWLAWGWVRNFRFRLLHLAAIMVVVFQSWLGALCPLTTWETQVRESTGGETYDDSFIQYWLHAILYYEAPDWVFTLVYTVFAGLVAASWFIVPPKRHE